MTESIRVSHSKLKSWRRCRNAHYYRYIEKLRPKKIERPLAFGSAVHKIAEFSIMGRTVAEAIEELNKKRATLFSAEHELWDQIHRDATLIMRSYFNYWRKEKLRFTKINDKLAEFKFEYELGQRVVITGVIDAIPYTPDGRGWITEHKSHKDMPDEGVRMRDVQTMLYFPIARDLFKVKKLAGVMWDYIRSKSPTIPDILKDGSVSKRKIDTLPEVYEEFLRKNKLDPKHYSDILGDLDGKLGSWFRRIYLPVNNDAVKQLREEALTTAREMHRKAGVDRTRNITRDCGWCSYESLCRAELFGLDAEFIREREFRVEEREPEPTEISE